MCCNMKWMAGLGLVCLAAVGLWGYGQVERARGSAAAAEKAAAKDKVDKVHPKDEPVADDHEFALPNPAWLTPFEKQAPIGFVNRSQNAAEWNALKAFWNETTEEAIDPLSGKKVMRKAVKIKVPLGLTSSPVVPVENPMTVEKWALGKDLYFDKILSSDKTVACASCHAPDKGFTDQARFSKGIAGKLGGMSAPTVFNTGYNALQFWDGRALSLEDQSQGPVMNALEMFGGDGHAWRSAVTRLRKDDAYVARFKAVFGTPPTRDTVAKAIATYERTVLSGNAIHDRAEQAMRKRVEEEETGKFVLAAKDYAAVIKAAFADKDEYALAALKLDMTKDAGKADEIARSLHAGRELFFNKARCSLCHVGDNFTDNTFHNLGVGATKDGKMPASQAGRYGSQPVGHKNPEFYGAFKTPTLRHLLGTGPYMHDGGEKSPEDVIEFYDRGGNVNEHLDVKMRDEDAERAWRLAKAEGKAYTGKAEVREFNGRPVAAKKLELTPDEKKNLVLFLRALQGDRPDPIVGDPKKMP